MTLQEFNFSNDNHFVELETHAFFSKSIYLVLLTKNYLIGLELNKSISTDNADSLFFQKFPNQETAMGSFQNPYSYIKEKYVKAIEKKYLFDQSIFAVSKNNFRIDRNDIVSADYDSAVISGFNYPNSGKINIQIKTSSRSSSFNKGRSEANKSLILLGNQNGKIVLQNILANKEQYILS